MDIKTILKNVEVTNIISHVCYEAKKLILRYKSFIGIK